MESNFREIFEKAIEDHAREIERELDRMINHKEKSTNIINRAKTLVTNNFGLTTWDRHRGIAEGLEEQLAGLDDEK